MRTLILGATGTIGRATAKAALDAGHSVTAYTRSPEALPDGAITVITGDAKDLGQKAFTEDPYDAVICCLAARNGSPKEAWAIDHRATVDAVDAAKASDAGHFTLLSAICVQKPRLAFQHAKLAAEEALQSSGLPYSIVRPTAYFKSLSGQIARVKAGKPYLTFGDGTLTACKPISDTDLAAYLLTCATDPARHNRILPIGGPGHPITPRQQGEHLFQLLGKPPKFRSIPPGFLKVTAATLQTLRLTEKAEFARIAHYYATESMLVLDPAKDRYDPDATPSTGTETLFDFYAKALADADLIERGDHSVF
ncbi:MAG: NAD(P)H-binding protein [Pseudomonadota bacterium]